MSQRGKHIESIFTYIKKPFKSFDFSFGKELYLVLKLKTLNGMTRGTHGHHGISNLVQF